MNIEWLTVKEAAQHLKVKPSTLLAWVRNGKVKGYALSGIRRRIWRFRREDLDRAPTEYPVLNSIPLSVRCSKEGELNEKSNASW